MSLSAKIRGFPDFWSDIHEGRPCIKGSNEQPDYNNDCLPAEYLAKEHLSVVIWKYQGMARLFREKPGYLRKKRNFGR